MRDLDKVQFENEGLRFVIPNSAHDYYIKFPGFPPEFYPVLETCGTSPSQQPYFRNTAGAGLGRRNRRNQRRARRAAAKSVAQQQGEVSDGEHDRQEQAAVH